MKESGKTRELLLKHYQKYPQLQIQDLFKFIHQSAFGCEHMVSSPEAAVGYIRREMETWTGDGENTIDSLDGAYSRVHLSCLKQGLRAETLGKLFYASARKEEMGRAELEKKLRAAAALVKEKLLPFSADEFEKAAASWRERGYPAVHHSEQFRAAYRPAYRVIGNRYAAFVPLFSKIDALLEKGAAVIAIEGGSASGKTTLSAMLEEIYPCTVFHMDDFFLRPEQRTPARYAEAGGNIDRERFLEEVLIPLSKNEPVVYRKFDCAAFELGAPTAVSPQKLTIIEGAYSMHPELAEYYDFSVFLDISPELQKARINKRNSPPMAARFFEEWIPLERTYFSKTRAQDRCDLSVLIRE